MVVELLYFDACPNWQTTYTELREVLMQAGSQEEVRLVNVRNNREARRLKFVGSPTVRVNGKDIEPDVPSSGFNLECRLYWVGGRPVGRPPREWLVNAIHQAESRSKGDSVPRLRDAMSLVQPHLLSLDAYEAVDPPEVLAARAGIPESQIVKLNGNENPYGSSPKVRHALANLDRAHIYPDPRQVAMRNAIGSYVEIAPEHIVVGNGSDEIIDLLFRAFLAPGDAIINCTPTFGMYSFTARMCGGTTLTVHRDEQFRVNIDAVLQAAESKGARVIVIASPNNPTGNATPPADIRRLLDAGLVVLLDEAYHEFGGQSMASAVPANPNLIVLRTLSKWAGLAGLRVGYGLMSPQLAEVLMRAKPPYSVSQAAEAALLASFDDLATLRERVGWLVRERERMRGLLKAQPGVTPWPSDANFILCQVPGGRGRTVYEGMARRGVFVRYFSGAPLADFFRVSAGTPEQTARFIEALAETMKD